MGEIDYGEIQQVLDDLLGQNVDFQNMAEQGASGNSPISFQNLLKMAEGLFFRELSLWYPMTAFSWTARQIPSGNIR